ncbi:DNA polymerase III subunit beta [Shinella zoogloeoides]|uniref:DNA polymerase III subunit beta n=1 Tax=Shinella zoogloeoides TaxID=352475 RepID=UPI0028AC3B47|nr:DNA polymerase III subunit beta [Shinella zoogloeoides]
MLKTDKAALAAAISAVIGVVSRTAKVPIMQNICIEEEAGELVMRGSSMDIEIASRVDVAFEDGFEPFTLPAHLLEDAVRRMPDGAEIVIQRVNDASGRMASVNIRSGRSRLKLPVLPASDFPKLDAGKLPHQISLDGSMLARRIKAVLPAVCTDLTRHFIAGVLLHPTEDGLRIVATDGKRLAVRLIPAIEIDQSEILSGIPKATVPTRVIERALKVMGGQEDVTIDLSSQKIRVAAGRTVLVGKLVEGVFPDYAHILPSASACRLSFSSAALQAAISRVLVVTPDAGNGVEFSAAEDRMTINAREMTIGDADDEIACESEAPVKGGFHGIQMRESLETTEADQVECLVSLDGAPMLLRAPGDEANYTILLPMQPKYARAQA